MGRALRPQARGAGASADAARLGGPPERRSVTPLRVAVVGAGVMGKFHAGIYAGLPGVDLVAVVDPSAERRREAEHQHGCATFSDIDAMLAAVVVDAASVAAPRCAHL